MSDSHKNKTGSTLPASRQAGICLHLTSLPGAYGIGEIGANALRFIDLLAAIDLSIWQFLPTGPTAFANSPYQPLSTFAGNELLIDTDSLLRLGLITANETQALRELPADRVYYGVLIPRKKAMLSVAAGRFASKASAQLKAGFDDFLQKHDADWLHDYAVYRVLKSQHQEGPWPDWDKPYVYREKAAISRVESDCREQIAAIKTIQFLFHHQWQALRHYAAEKNVRLFGDMPIGIALDSADAWAHPELLRIDRGGRAVRVGGVPPDYFTADGQLWGNPLYDWDYHAASDYHWWIERLKSALEIADLVRIDHFRGFEACWTVPAGATTARTGKWEPGPGDAIFEAMRVALGHLPIVAEDLGVITPEVEALRDRHQIPGMVVLQFEAGDPEFDLDDITENCFCYTGTHDNDTTVGWFRGGPGDNRSEIEILNTQKNVLRLTGGGADTIHTDLIKLAFASKARVAIVPMQDFLGLGSEARLNTPGTSSNNWRWRLLDEQISSICCDSVRGLVHNSGRGTSS